jgi:hypothetical protein
MHETRRECEASIPGVMDRRADTYAALGLVVVGLDEEGPKDRPFVMKQPGPLPRVVAGERAHDGKPAWGLQSYFYCYPSSFDQRGPKTK